MQVRSTLASIFREMTKPASIPATVLALSILAAVRSSAPE
jgi:hypothetical protein